MGNMLCLVSKSTVLHFFTVLSVSELNCLVIITGKLVDGLLVMRKIEVRTYLPYKSTIFV